MKINILIENDVIAIKKTLISISNKIAFIASCKVTNIIVLKQKDQFIKRILLTANTFNISLQTKLFINIRYFTLLKDINFLSLPAKYISLFLNYYIINCAVIKVLVYNEIY